MRKTKYTVKPTTQFKKDYKLAIKRELKISLLEDMTQQERLERKQVPCRDILSE